MKPGDDGESLRRTAQMARIRSTWNETPLADLRAMQDPDEPDIVARLVKTFREDVAPRLAVLSDLAVHGEFAAIRATAHRLKGGALSLGAEKLGAAAASLEAAAMRCDRATCASLIDEVVREHGRFLARAVVP